MASDTSLMNSQASTQALKETQEITDSQNLDQSLIDDKIWGMLLSVRRHKQVYNLVHDSHSFGRGRVDHQFTEAVFDDRLLPTLSKTHFIISREVQADNECVVFLEDKSQNGTYLNKTLIGKNKKRFLRNNDEISLSQPNMRVFIFHDCLKNDSKDYPPELKKKYLIMRKIGDGTYGEVRLAYSEDTLHRAAVKIIKKKLYTEEGKNLLKINNLAQINNEILLLRSVNHPCIVKFLDIIESDDKIFIVMELAEGGELFDRISDNGSLKEPIAKLYFYQLVHAIAYLHKMRITHRDIKPENILLASDDEYTKVKLTDFGLSKITHETSAMSTFCGTQMYIAPELLGGTTYNSKVDMWSLGVVLFVSLVGYLPFQGKTDAEKLGNIKKGNYFMKHKNWDTVSEVAKDLVRKLLVVDPDQRLSAAEVLKHEWLQDNMMIRRVQSLFNRVSVSSQPIKRQRDSDDEQSMVDAKTPKLMSGLEFHLQNTGNI